ncbi:hypothetical protein FRX31_022494 [Thalictrum thalictroides]|uniref:Uncharacterized protein n=1 Tax=Thalictrum thalictroides TaxID=46969 RepID=A0A7J6VTK9_THATH|nr:hypothetical protein FRX31_022494 [Thalictrum thalictroides]
MDAYLAASNSKLNISKTVVVPVGPETTWAAIVHPQAGQEVTDHSSFAALVPAGSTSIFCHLGVYFTPKGIALGHMESTLLKAMADRIASWRVRKATLLGKVLVANVFLLSKIWYLAHIAPFSCKFHKEVEKLLWSWLWGALALHPPMALGKLHGSCRDGGAGLQDPRLRVGQILSKWLAPVIDPRVASAFLPPWARAANENWLASMGITRRAARELPRCLAKFQGTRKIGPNSSGPIWRAYLDAFKRSPLSLNKATPWTLCCQGEEMLDYKITRPPV